MNPQGKRPGKGNSRSMRFGAAAETALRRLRSRFPKLSIPQIVEKALFAFLENVEVHPPAHYRLLDPDEYGPITRDIGRLEKMLKELRTELWKLQAGDDASGALLAKILRDADLILKGIVKDAHKIFALARFGRDLTAAEYKELKRYQSWIGQELASEGNPRGAAYLIMKKFLEFVIR